MADLYMDDMLTTLRGVRCIPKRFVSNTSNLEDFDGNFAVPLYI